MTTWKRGQGRRWHLFRVMMIALLVGFSLCLSLLWLLPSRYLFHPGGSLFFLQEPFNRVIHQPVLVGPTLNAGALPNASYPLRPLSVAGSWIQHGQVDYVFVDSPAVQPPLATVGLRKQPGTGMSLSPQTAASINALLRIARRYNATAPLDKQIHIVFG